MADRQCVMCNFATSDQELMKRHIVINHGVSMYSTCQCGVCDRKYYDFDHFIDHVRETPSCLNIKRVPLTPQAENAFVSLVDHMTTPVQSQSALFPSIGCSESSGSFETIAAGESTSTSHRSDDRYPSIERPFSVTETLDTGEGTSRGHLRSNCQSSSSAENSFLDLNVEGTSNSATPKIVSVTSLANQGNLIDQSSMMSTENGVKSEILEQETMESTREMDMVMDEDNMEQEEELEPVLDRETRGSLGRKVQETWISANQASDTFESGNVGELKKNRNPPHILKARRAYYEKVKEFIKNGKLHCQLCSKSIFVSCPGTAQNGIGYVMDKAITHVTMHVEGCHLFECSACHMVTKTRISIYRHAKKCQKGSPANVINRSNQYYKEILNQFLVCFDPASSGDTGCCFG